jgi:hypothetical protein
MEARSQLRHRPTLAGCNSSILSAGQRFVNYAAWVWDRDRTAARRARLLAGAQPARPNASAGPFPKFSAGRFANATNRITERKCKAPGNAAKRNGGKSKALAADPSLGCLKLTLLPLLPQEPIAIAWLLPAARCWPAPARRFRSGSESRTSTCSWSPPRNPWPELHSARKPRSPAACSSRR